MRGSTRRRRPLVPVAALLLTGSLVGACGEPSEDERRDALADELIDLTDGALDETQATCVADGLFDAFGQSGLDRVVAVANGEDPNAADVLEGDGDSSEDERESAAADVRTQVIDVFAGCDALDRLLDP